MKHALSALLILVLLGCEKPDDSKGYVAGYNLTCGYQWDAGNAFVLDKEFAYNFLAGSRECVRKHPERARNVLGLAGASQVMQAKEAEKPRKLPHTAAHTMETGQAPDESAKAPVTTNASGKSVPPAKPQPAKAPKASPRATDPVRAKAPAKAKSAEKPKAPAKAKATAKPKAPAKAKATAKPKAPAKAEVAAKPKAPVTAEAPPKAKAPDGAKAPAEVVDATSISGKPSVSTPESAPPPFEVEPRQQTRRKESNSSYELFMGD